MKNVLVLFAHPALEKSRVNRRWKKAAENVAGVTFRDLYQIYPEFDVNPKVEQEVLSQHDVIVMQHPFYWYSTPAIMKQWFDIVLEHGWAYGKEGDKLAGKHFLSAITTGGKQEAYTPEGFHGVTMAELLAPIRQTARLCQMVWLPPFVGFGVVLPDGG